MAFLAIVAGCRGGTSDEKKGGSEAEAVRRKEFVEFVEGKASEMCECASPSCIERASDAVQEKKAPTSELVADERERLDAARRKLNGCKNDFKLTSPEKICAKRQELMEASLDGDTKDQMKESEKRFPDSLTKIFYESCVKDAIEERKKDAGAYRKAANCVMDAKTLEEATKCGFGKKPGK